MFIVTLEIEKLIEYVFFDEIRTMKRKQGKLDSFFSANNAGENAGAGGNKKRKLKLNMSIILRLATERIVENDEIISNHIPESTIPAAATVTSIASSILPSTSTSTLATKNIGSDCVSASIALTSASVGNVATSESCSTINP